jgi:threonine dehydrogenase-like Zn-dependent dehydrogenase
MQFNTLQITQPKQVKITPIDADLVPGEEEVLVEIKRVSLCGSDYRLFNGTYTGPSTYPLRFGHEWSGMVIDTGADVTGVEEGDRVTGDCSIWCGHCAMCLVDKNLCRNVEKYGITVDGFSAQRVVVPAQYVYRDAYYLSYDTLALAELFAVALHAIKRFGDPPREPAHNRTLIVGCGPVGIALYMLLKLHFNWMRVDVYDVVPERVARLQSLLPGKPITNSIPDPGKLRGASYKELYGCSPYSLVFEAAGHPDALRLAIDIALPRATVVSLGMPASSEYDLSKVTTKSLNVVGSIGGTGEFRETLDFFAGHADLVRKLVTATYPYSEAERAFTEGQDPKQNLKVQIQFGE